MLNDVSIRDFWHLLPRPPHWVMSDKTVNVRVTAAQFGDAKAMQKITATVLGKLGCEGCHSGFDVRYLVERDFRVNHNLDVLPVEHF